MLILVSTSVQPPADVTGNPEPLANGVRRHRAGVIDADVVCELGLSVPSPDGLLRRRQRYRVLYYFELHLAKNRSKKSH